MSRAAAIVKDMRRLVQSSRKVGDTWERKAIAVDLDDLDRLVSIAEVAVGLSDALNKAAAVPERTKRLVEFVLRDTNTEAKTARWTTESFERVLFAAKEIDPWVTAMDVEVALLAVDRGGS